MAGGMADVVRAGFVLGHDGENLRQPQRVLTEQEECSNVYTMMFYLCSRESAR